MGPTLTARALAALLIAVGGALTLAGFTLAMVEVVGAPLACTLTGLLLTAGGIGLLVANRAKVPPPAKPPLVRPLPELLVELVPAVLAAYVSRPSRRRR